MLVQPNTAAATTHRALQQASCVHGVADLHAMVTARLAYAAASGRPAASEQELAWALQICPPYLFGQETVSLGGSAPPSAAAPRAGRAASPEQLPLWPDGPGAALQEKATGPLGDTLSAALDVVDALVVLAAARLSPPSPGQATWQPNVAALPARARASLAAAWQAARWPKVRLSPRFSPVAAHEVGHRRGRALRQILARLDLLHRPLNLWFGPRTPTALLSPYVRDTERALLAAAPGRLLALGVAGPWPAGPNLAYALADALCQQLPAVATERAAAEAAVGIHAYQLAGVGLEVIDAAALRPGGWDARLPVPKTPPWRAFAEAPVIVRCPYVGDPGSQAASVAELAGLLVALAPARLAQICVAAPAVQLADQADLGLFGATLRCQGDAADLALPLVQPGPRQAVAAAYGAKWQVATAMPLNFDAALLAHAVAAAAPARTTWAGLAAAGASHWAHGLSLAHAWLALPLGYHR